jgi:glycine betaine/proline transport system permease protein
MGPLANVAPRDHAPTLDPGLDLLELNVTSEGTSVAPGRHHAGSSLRDAGAAVLVAVLVVGVSRLVVGHGPFPSSLRFHLGDRAERFTEWATVHWSPFYQPVVDALTAAFEQVLTALQLAPAPTVALVLVAVVYWRSGVRLALLCVGALLWVISVGVWNQTLETLALMTVAVGVCAVFGVAIGIVASTNRYLDLVVRTALDWLQAFPYFAYLVVVVVVFGPGDTATLLVTIIWALPPISRMTTVGIRGVSPEVVEAARSVGATPLQVLRKVKLPLARRSIAAGLNQTIMFAISMATISALIGGTGLGQPVWSGLTRLEFGQALAPGIALVLLAVVMDRASQPRDVKRQGTPPAVDDDGSRALWGRFSRWTRSHLRLSIALAVVVPFSIVAGSVPRLAFADFSAPPESLRIQLRDPVNSAITWVNVHFGSFLDAFSNALQSYGINPLTNALEWMPWTAVLILGFMAGFLTLRVAGGILVAAAMAMIGAMGMWEPAINTVAIVGVAVFVSLLVGFPTGVLMSRSDRIAAVLRPVLDVMQTLPIFLFVIPVVIFLGAGPVAGTLATVAYAVTPLIRLTNSALRGADPEVVEAARSFGATERRVLFQVRVPLGLPTIMVGVNQTILLALAMVVVSAFIGTPGLGEEVLAGVTQAQLGRGIEAGLSMFLLALIVERIFTGAARRIGGTQAAQLVR